MERRDGALGAACVIKLAQKTRERVAFFNVGTGPHGPLFRGAGSTIISKKGVFLHLTNSTLLQ